MSSDRATAMLADRPHTSPALGSIIGRDPALLAVLDRVRRVAPTRTPVLITGESGTGKEQIARALHELGPAPEGPCVVVNCGTLPRELAESELFGHERGAFTGAAARRAGWFEEAEGGTLVLDEIGELPLELQPKLLRTLESGVIRRVGGSGERRLRVRVVAMTLRDLRREISRGAFRLDLFFRLAGFELALPALRERPGDIPALARAFLRDVETDVGARAFDESALAWLSDQPWPGNVRELRNLVRRAAIVTNGRIDAAALARESSTTCEIRLAEHAAEAGGSYPLPASKQERAAPRDSISLTGKTFDAVTNEVFLWALGHHEGSRRRAARALRVSRSTFCDRIKRLTLAGQVSPG